MEINGVSPVSGPNQINSIQAKTSESASQVPEKTAAVPQKDVVDVNAAQTSGTSQASDVTFSGMKVDGIRTDLVNRVRAEIANGTYDTPEKMDIALERLLDSLGE